MTDLTLDPIKSKADLLRYLKNRIEEAKRNALESQECAEERHLGRCVVGTLQRTYDDIASACVSWDEDKIVVRDRLGRFGPRITKDHAKRIGYKFHEFPARTGRHASRLAQASKTK